MNVLVTDDYSCKLADFGTAKVHGETSWQNTANAGIQKKKKNNNNYMLMYYILF